MLTNGMVYHSHDTPHIDGVVISQRKRLVEAKALLPESGNEDEARFTRFIEQDNEWNGLLRKDERHPQETCD